jgi:predicted NBD/HSP70 family sugar kinase
MPNDYSLTILQNIRRAGQLTRRDLAGQLDLGMSMISKLTADLIERGLLREAGRSNPGSGRPSDLLALNPRAGYAVGLDVGGNHMRAIVSDFCGGIVTQVDGPGPVTSSRSEIMDSFEAILAQALGQAGLTRKDVRGVGISLYGSVDSSTGEVYSWTETPGGYTIWKNFGVRDAFLERWPLPHVYVDDVVRTLGIAEVLYGRARTSDQDFVYVLADTGIGVALMIQGQPYVGSSQLAGELGHIPINHEKIPCSCGSVGCLETIASVHAVLREVRTRLEEDIMESTLSALEHEPGIQEIVQAAGQGDKLAYRILSEAGDALGRGIAIVLNLFGSSQVVLGGVLTTSSVYLDSAHRSIRLNALSKVTQTLDFQRSELDQFAAARGAASIVLNALFQPGDHNALNIG